MKNLHGVYGLYLVTTDDIRRPYRYVAVFRPFFRIRVGAQKMWTLPYQITTKIDLTAADALRIAIQGSAVLSPRVSREFKMIGSS